MPRLFEFPYPPIQPDFHSGHSRLAYRKHVAEYVSVIRSAETARVAWKASNETMHTTERPGESVASFDRYFRPPSLTVTSTPAGFPTGGSGIPHGRVER
jgi:hypothetical protein